jgi:hypothetical protein
MKDNQRLKRAWAWVYHYQEECWRLKLQLADAHTEIERLRTLLYPARPYDYEQALQPAKEE